jgi:hypothetical protein
MFFGFALATVAIVLIDAAVTGRSVIGVIQGKAKGSAKVANATATGVTGVTGGTNATGGVVTSTGGASGAASAAGQALAQKGNYDYSETRPYPSSLFGPAPVKIDCSGFATLCYKAAKLPDPNGLGYSGAGWTGTLKLHGKRTLTPQAGDLAFYSGPEHVTVCMGDGSCISMGQQGDPTQLPVTFRVVTEYRTYVQAPNTNPVKPNVLRRP